MNYYYDFLNDHCNMVLPKIYFVVLKTRQCRLFYKLNRSLHDFKLPPRQWYKFFDSYMFENDYRRHEYVCYVYVRSLDDDSFIFLLLYLHDKLTASNVLYDINELKILLRKEFEMKDFGVAKQIIDIKLHIRFE